MPCLDDSRKIKFLFLLSKNSLINHTLVIEKKAKINSPPEKNKHKPQFCYLHTKSTAYKCVCVLDIQENNH